MSGSSDYTLTAKLGLYKPTYNADTEQWGNHLNSNADTLDNLPTKTYVDGAIAANVPTSGNIVAALGYVPYDSANPAHYQTDAQVAAAVGSSVANYVPLSQRAALNGVATLDGTGVVPTTQLPGAVTGTLSYKGGWNASTNTPVMATGALAGGVLQTAGSYYLVTVGATTAAIDGITTWVAGDWISSNGTIWQRVQNSTSPYLPLAGGQMGGTLTAAGGAAFTLYNQAALPSHAYEYLWYDPQGRIAGGILSDGSLYWSAATIQTLSVPTASFPHIIGTTVIDTLQSGTQTAGTISVGGNTLGTLNPQAPGWQYAWYDSNGSVAGGIDSTGQFKWGDATINNLLIGTDPTDPADAVRLSYFNSHALTTAANVTLTGPLYTTFVTPVAPNELASKQYVDSSAASGGAGGLAGLVAQRDFPYPPLRDPKRDYGAIGDGVTDDTTALNACVDAALAAGERAIAINDTFNCPNLKVEACNLVFIGNGALKNNKIWKWPIPPWAPPPPRRFNTTLIMRKHCPGFTAKVRANAAVKVVITGDSGGNPNSNGFTGSAVVWARARRAILEQNPGINVTFFNRSVGGQQWQNLDSIPSSVSASWYTTPSRPWLDYIHDCDPDLVMITLGAADSWNYSMTSMLSVLAKMRGWAKVPDIIFITSQPVPQATQVAGSQPTPQDNANYVMNGDMYATSINRSYALAHGIGMIDTFRSIMLHRMGVDFEDMPLLRDTTVTGGYIQARLNIPLPYTWPVPCFGYGGYFYVNVNSWTNLGNEVQFEIGNNAASNGGNIFRIGRDTASGNVYYQVDTTTTAAGAAQNEIFIPKTIVPNWPSGGGDMSFQFSVCGSQLMLTAFATPSTPLLDQYLEVYCGPVPRIFTQWQPKITCSAGTVSGRLFFEKAADTAAHALTANPHPRALYWQTLTDYEANGPRAATPDTSPWGGGGTAHSSVLSGILCIQSAIDSCDFSAGA